MEFSLQSLLVVWGILIALYLLPSLIPAYRFALAGLGVFIAAANSYYILVKNKKNFLNLTRLFSLHFFISILILLIVYYVSGFVVLTDTYGLEKVLTQYGTAAKFVYLLICLAQPIVLPIPEAITVGAGSAVFGSFQAAWLSFSGTFSGILIMYSLARYGGSKIVSKFVKERHLEQYRNYVKKNETFIMGILFIVPVLPDEIICMGAGISRVSMKRFVIIAALSKLFTSFALAYSVKLAGYFEISNTQFMIDLTAIITVIFLVSYFSKRLRT